MSRMTVLQALNAAMAWELEHDPDVVLLGEDVGTAGGIFRVTQGLQLRFGPERVIDTPLDEAGIAGHAVGMALYGMKPVAEIQFSGFIHDAFEQIMFNGAKYRWLTGGQYAVPMVIRAPSYGGIRGGFWHSQSIESYYAHGGGMKIVSPNTPQDAYGLLLAAIRDPDPVLVSEPVPFYRSVADDVEDDGAAATIGEARVLRHGSDLTVVAYGPPAMEALRVADELAAERGLDIEVLDLRTLIPYDVDAITTSVDKTGRAVIVHEAPYTLGFGAELAASIQERVFDRLHAPILRVAAPDLPYPYSMGDEHYRPGAKRIRIAIQRTLDYAF